MTMYLADDMTEAELTEANEEIRANREREKELAYAYALAYALQGR